MRRIHMASFLTFGAVLCMAVMASAAPRHLIHIWADDKSSADVALRLEVLAWQAVEKMHGAESAQFLPVEAVELEGFQSALKSARELLASDTRARRGPELLDFASQAYVEARNQMVHMSMASLADLHALLALAAHRTGQGALVGRYLHTSRNVGGREFFLPGSHAELARAFAKVDADRVAQPTVPLAITSEPTGARVIVDGVEAGETPLTLSVGMGGHAVVLSLLGHWRKGALVDAGLTGGSRTLRLRPHRGRTRFENSLKSVPRDIRKGRTREAAAGVEDLAVLTEADAVMALVVQGVRARKTVAAHYRIRGIIRPPSGAVVHVDEVVPQDASILGVFDGFALSMSAPVPVANPVPAIASEPSP